MALFSALMPVLTAACTSTVESSTGSTSSASAGAGTSAVTGGVGGASPTTMGGVEMTSNTTGGSGKSCHTLANCEPSEFCDYPDDMCGTDRSGTCVPRPQICDDNYEPVWACDCKYYSNACKAAAAGVDVDVAHPGCPK